MTSVGAAESVIKIDVGNTIYKVPDLKRNTHMKPRVFCCTVLYVVWSRMSKRRKSP